MNDSSNSQLLKLSLLLLLEQRVRDAEKNELPFIIVNETSKIIPYQQAILWQPQLSWKKQIRSISGVTAPDPHSPFFLWLKKNLPAMERCLKCSELPVLLAYDQLPAPVQSEWTKWFSPYIMWIPLSGPGKKKSGTLMLVRTDPFQDAETTVMRHISGAFGHALAHENKRSSVSGNFWQQIRRKIFFFLLLLTMSLLFFLPIRQFTMAPAEVIPVEPVVIRSPLDGVIKTIFKSPNTMVSRGEPLFELDEIKLVSQRDVASQRLEIARTELLQAQQMAFNNLEAKSQIAILAQKIELEQSEVNYLEALLKRIVVRAPQNGLLIFDDPDEWIGRPVEIGQKIILLANPDNIELKISIPVKEAVEFKEYGSIDFFMNISPTLPSKATVRHISYSTHVTLENTTAYRMWASFITVPENARIGLQGTAKVYGSPTHLGIWILRKPLNMILRWLN